MDANFRFADLSQEDLTRLKDMERELNQSYDNEIVLIAYEKSRPSAPSDHKRSKRPHVDPLGNDINKRGSTFGYADVHGDHYPTLAGLTADRLIEAEDLRFSDTEPPNRG